MLPALAHRYGLLWKDEPADGKFTVRSPAVSSLRRNLQAEYLQRLAKIALGQSPAPHDCRVIARAELATLGKQIDKLLKRKGKLDPYSRAHFVEMSGRIRQVLKAQLVFEKP